MSEWEDDVKYFSTSVQATVMYFDLTVFSSPLTCLFLGFLNYFTLNSLYVLLNIQLPQIIFKELSQIYSSVNSNLITTIDSNFTISPFSDQLVKEQRALYFGISSDIITSNYYSFGVVIANIIITQLALFIKRFFRKKNCIQSLLKIKRSEVYFGLIVSIILGIILPWKFVVHGSVSSLRTKLNSICQYFMYAIIAYFLWATFISITQERYKQKSNKKRKSTKKKINITQNLKVSPFQNQKLPSKKQKISILLHSIPFPSLKNVLRLPSLKKSVKMLPQKKSKKQKRKMNYSNILEKIGGLPEWMIAFQNFLYPLLVLLSNSYYFLIIVFISKTLQMVIFARNSKKIAVTKYIQIASYVCELVFNCTFFIFASTKQGEIVLYACFICLISYLLGAVLNIVIVLIYIILIIRAAIWKICCLNKISPANAIKNSSSGIKLSQNYKNIINSQQRKYETLQVKYANSGHINNNIFGKVKKNSIRNSYSNQQNNKSENQNKVIEHRRSKYEKFQKKDLKCQIIFQ